MTSLNPAKFMREVRQEVSKITWPTRKETIVSTVMVFGLAALAAVFFIVVDWIISTLVLKIIGI
jgi:preprotein translocase subunit SecE